MQVWHAAAGSSDIGVEAYAVAALAALLRREWGLAGILAAGTAWAKNDGLVIFMPPLLVGAWLLQPGHWRHVAWFLAGCATLAPWLLVKTALSLGLAPNRERFAWHPDTPLLFVDKVLLGPTSGILWIVSAGCLLWSLRALWRDATGRALVAIMVLIATALLVVYGCTESHIWLVNEGTIHRSMLQLAATAVVVACYGLWKLQAD